MVTKNHRTALEAWFASSKLIPAAGYMACTAAASVNDIILCCQMARENKLINGQVSLPDLDVWQRMYQMPGLGMPMRVADVLVPHEHPRDHRYLSAAIANYNNPARTSARKLKWLLRLIPKRLILSEAAKYNEALEHQFQYFWDTYRMPEDECPEFPPAFEQAMSHPEVLFFCRVTFPCHFEFGISPNRLYRDAAAGDIDALVNLISLDPLAFDLEPIRLRYVSALYGSDAAVVKRVKEAQTKPPKRAVKPQKVKYLVGAQIYKSLDYLDGCLLAFEKEIRRRGHKSFRAPRAKISYPDLQRLFDAVAKDKFGHEIDPDLPLDPRSFERGVRRELPFWQLLSV